MFAVLLLRLYPLMVSAYYAFTTLSLLYVLPNTEKRKCDRYRAASGSGYGNTWQRYDHRVVLARPA